MKNKKLLIFDFDGVLVFSVHVTFECIIDVAKKLGVKFPGFRLIKACWGKNIHDDLFPKLAKELNWTFKQMEYVKESFLKENKKLIYPLPDSISDFLKKASEAKDLAILSNRKLSSLIVCSHKLGIDLSLFKNIVCPQNGLYKPDPKTFNFFWKIGYRPEETVFVGDSIIHDLSAAKNHIPSIDFVAISSGLHEKSEFMAAGVPKDLVLKSPVEMEKWL